LKLYFKFKREAIVKQDLVDLFIHSSKSLFTVGIDVSFSKYFRLFLWVYFISNTGDES